MPAANARIQKDPFVLDHFSSATVSGTVTAVASVGATASVTFQGKRERRWDDVASPPTKATRALSTAGCVVVGGYLVYIDPPGRALAQFGSSLSVCLRVLNGRATQLATQQVEALTRQLTALLSDEDELKEVGISASTTSLSGLIDFLVANQTTVHPSLSIASNGYFVASWSPRPRAELTALFKSRENVEWVAIDLNATPPVHKKGSLAAIPDQFALWMFA